ncbi:hypothetical protein M406DRAFT_356027 [Cryphonectria parasitica EP155]|uniref:Uncharacterized protein n=1 Tax=Cryphonectria parasitica (strain ATCC 38755 / EP155) TaxID=660469 RepID=A0A9P4Y330_CRYP1|nr:uncharacterized protein M406DRAFT_356027 [Cryphonectria parasitica EP155]KAF3765721.1 hypothetical protein M406DRAFT_356027 [Cryphonectria parasitica EP155]
MYKCTAILLLSCLRLSRAKFINHRQRLTPPPECDVIPVWEVTTFEWFNSSHNLDCADESNVPNVCINSTASGQAIPCDSNAGPCLECGLEACLVGLPLQPAGYGPPDNITIGIASTYPWYSSCAETNPQAIRRWEVGDGIVFCGGVAYYVNFIGDSNSAVGPGHIDFDPITSWDCTNGSTITASGSVDFEIACTRDAYNNATCVIPANKTVIIPILSYTID